MLLTRMGSGLKGNRAINIFFIEGRMKRKNVLAGLAVVLMLITQAHALSERDVWFCGVDAKAVYGPMVQPDLTAWIEGNNFTLIAQLDRNGAATGSLGELVLTVSIGIDDSYLGNFNLSSQGNNLPVTIDFAVVLQVGDLYVVYFFNDVALLDYNDHKIGEYIVAFGNHGFSSLSLYARNLRFGEVPEPTNKLLFNADLID